jgi:uncharacterized protein (TIGR00290 family)
MEKVLVSWSGGKDSAMALHTVLSKENLEIAALLTTVNEEYDRISMHGVRRSLLELQAESLGFPLEKVFLSTKNTNEEYELQMSRILEKYKALGVTSVVFGDIFLEDLKKYREEQLARLGMHGIFPLWKNDTGELLRSFIGLKFKAVIVCVDTQNLAQHFAGMLIDEQFISEFPGNVDICGENGEYHSFVYDGPIFKSPVYFALGEKVLREDRFYYCDLQPIPEV